MHLYPSRSKQACLAAAHSLPLGGRGPCQDRRTAALDTLDDPDYQRPR